MRNYTYLLALCISLMAPCLAEAQTAAQYGDKGLAAYQSQNYPEAISQLNKGIAADGKYSLNYYYRAYAYMKTNELDKALQDLTTAIQIAPDSTFYLVCRSEVYIAQNNENGALGDLSKYITIVPNDADAFYRRGHIFYNKNLYDKAIADFTAALNIERLPRAYFERGVMYNRLSKNDLALADYNAAIAMEPGYLMAVTNKAQTIALMPGRIQDAIKFLKDEESVGKLGTYWFLFSTRGNLYMKTDQYTEAIADLTKAVTLGAKDPDTYNNKAVSEYKLKKYDDAMASANKAIEADPNYATAYNTRARVYSDNGQPEKGLPEAEKAIALNPKDKEFWASKAICLYKMGKVDEARALKEKIDKM